MQSGDAGCFLCGPDNPYGLQLTFDLQPDTRCAATETILDSRFCGWPGRAHGGIVAALLDEVMVYACRSLGHELVVTARLNVRFRAPVPVGRRIRVLGEVKQIKGKSLKATAVLSVGDEVLAEGDATLLLVDSVTG